LQLKSIFILAELPEKIAERVRTINERYDPKLARYRPPHITLTGSSGAGPIPPSVSAEEMRERLEPITAQTSTITLSFQIPQRFMQTDIIVLPIGAADMPVVISLLNAATGVAASATGFVLHQNVLIVSGMLVGASGTLLTLKMARAMGRSVTNVLFGAFGQVQVSGAEAAAAGDGQVRSASAEDVALRPSTAS